MVTTADLRLTPVTLTDNARETGLTLGVVLAVVLAGACIVGVATGSGEKWPVIGDFLRSYEIERAERDGRLTEVPSDSIIKIITTDELSVGDCYTKPLGQEARGRPAGLRSAKRGRKSGHSSAYRTAPTRT
ncbi:MAG: hypothetical protein H6675_03365 [Dehalococcoidia bacterium]|nr:hypothetical protein [Dehalococcoidia bacterium]